jgi:heterodisulfide reductase subunit A
VVVEDGANIGVFLCECGGKIANSLDVGVLQEAAARMPGVTLAKRQRYCCSKAGLREIGKSVGDLDLGRVVIAGCTPRTHSLLFEKALEGEGLDPSCLEIVNIREQCAWVHEGHPRDATRKALDLTRMGVVKAAAAEPGPGTQIEVTPAALVIGGGTAGLTAAATVASRGFPVVLVERERELGGQVAGLHTLYPGGESAEEFIEKRISAVEGQENIQVFTGSTVTDVSGPVGDYRVAVARDGQRLEFRVGTVIVATGAREEPPGGEFQHSEVRVITESDLERALREDGVKTGDVVTLVYEPDSEVYTSVAASTALKNSVVLKQRYPEAAISLIFNDLSSDLSTEMLEQAKKLGVSFYKYDGKRTPRLVDHGVEVLDQLRGKLLTIPAEMLVLAMPLVPHDGTASISRMLSLPVDEHGFLLEPNVRLRPGSALPRGIFVCGSAHYPASAKESVFQGYRAAARALRHLTARTLVRKGPNPRVSESLCVGCGTCVQACPFGAISMIAGQGMLSVSSIDPTLCVSCGNCAVVCPAKAIRVEPSRDRALMAQIDAALAGDRDSQCRILAFLCEWSGYAAADLAGAERLQYPTNTRIIRVQCAARFDPYLVLWAFLQGADGVILGGCDPGMCHYVEGNRWAARRLETLNRMLDRAGFDCRRLRLQWFKPDDAEQFVETVSEFAEEIEYLGPTGFGPAYPIWTTLPVGGSRPRGESV